MTKNKELLRAILEEYQQLWQQHDSATLEVVIDPRSQHYQLLRYGWAADHKFVHHAVFSFVVKRDKIWLLRDNTDVEIVEQLVQRGIDRGDFVIAFIPENERQYTEYAVN